MDKNEYIKASDLYEFRSELMDMFIYLCNGNDFNKLTLLTISETIDKIYGKYDSRPLADVEEVKYARWKVIRQFSSIGGLRYRSCKCTNCGYSTNFFADESEIPKFCPECGAKMDGEKK